MSIRDRSFTIAPLNIPLATTFTLDGVCTDDGYATANTLVLKPYNLSLIHI